MRIMKARNNLKLTVDKERILQHFNKNELVSNLIR